jgi:signal transduction histidine kinase
MADRDCLLHVFENLFRNAIDHNDDDAPLRVAVDTLDARADGGDGSIDGFVVEDDGDGLPESATGRDALFEYGYTTSDDGTGLGLSIVQDVVEAHGWEITARDAPDGGARFEITGVDTRR